MIERSAVENVPVTSVDEEVPELPCTQTCELPGLVEAEKLRLRPPLVGIPLRIPSSTIVKSEPVESVEEYESKMRAFQEQFHDWAIQLADNTR